MLRYFIRRLLWACVLFVAVTLVTFVIFFVIPADPAREVCGQRATAECIVRARHFLGLDRPMIVQYARLLDRLVVHQSLGRSFTNRQDVTREVLTAAPVTASLVLGGAVIWLLVSIPLGILSALRRGRCSIASQPPHRHALCVDRPTDQADVNRERPATRRPQLDAIVRQPCEGSGLP